jgi:hypothetical protein
MYQLFIDESGDFSKRDGEVVVGGLLFRTDDAAELEQRMRAGIARAFTLVPYPPHTSHLNIPVAHALAALRAGVHEETPATHHVHRRIAPALRELEQCPHDVLALAREREVPWEKLQAADEWLRNRSRRGAHAYLTWLLLERFRKLTRLLRECGERFHGVAVATFDTGRASVPEEGRYLRGLEALLERVYQLVAAPGVEVCVAVQVLGRGLEQVSGKRTYLARHHVERACSSAIRFPIARNASAPRVTWQLTQPVHFGPSVHPGLVLADFVVNRCWQRVLRSGDWSAVERQAKAQIRLPVTAHASFGGERGSPLPTVAAEGLPRSAIHAAFAAGSGVPELPSGFAAVRPAWAREQAQAWIEAAL